MRKLVLFLGFLPLTITAPAQAQDSVGRAVTEPLRDTRVKDDKIPPILQQAASAPYATSGLKSCGAIRDEIAKLDAALGPDVDTPAKDKGEGAAVAAAAARAVVNSFIPGLGLVRVVTGADKQQRRAEAAVYAGSVRRGYLKGVGLSRKCQPPAAPSFDARKATPEILPDDKG